MQISLAKARWTAGAVAALALTLAWVALVAPDRASAHRVACGEITASYAPGSAKYRFKVYVTKGKVPCGRARFVLKRGTRVNEPDPKPWKCALPLTFNAYGSRCRANGGRRVIQGHRVRSSYR